MQMKLPDEDEEEMSQDAATEDELGVNDEFFNFNDFKYQGKIEFSDIEAPEMMQDMFESAYGKATGANRMLDSPMGLKKKPDTESIGSMPQNFNRVPSEINRDAAAESS